MDYDPIKRSLGVFFDKTPLLRKLFYRLLDVLLLRTWHVHKALRRLRRELPAGARILDAGSGFGQYDYYLARRWPRSEIDAVDVKEEQIADCTRFFARAGFSKVHFSVADLTQYMCPDRYGLVLSVDVMEHILDDAAVFSNFCRSLVPGGVLLLSTPSDLSEEEEHGDTPESFIGEHVRVGYPVQEMREKLQNAGFSDIRVRYTYGAVGQLAWRLSMKYPVSMLGRSRWFFLLLPFYYMVVFPFCLLLNWADLHFSHKSGTGLIVEARR
ncbi:MAG: class I SAM-dependent methyltransferase [Bacteroidales bacterium]|nr:class I SAM-dependent methyltransferase [Bacteroidales bacterium]